MFSRDRNDSPLLPENQRLLALADGARLKEFDSLRPPIFQCPTRVLMVTDGALDFSLNSGFGLGVFATIILDMRVPVVPRVTLATITGGNLLNSDDRIVERIREFKFDDPNHFSRDKYDVVFLFGFADRYNRETFWTRDDGYKSTHLIDSEIDAIAQYMDAGGGLFVTGDHGELGKALGERLPRAGKMRLWDKTSSDEDDDEVSMEGPRRNDTNRPGDAGSQFEDQSDDIPQSVNPRYFSYNTAIYRYTYPHPLLCGPNGVIRVMPDHPHEGECVEPDEINESITVNGQSRPEFPASITGGSRPLPTIVSTNSVIGGNVAAGTSSFTDGTLKSPTIPHSFGGVCAYDGQRAGVGRVVTDATWHHFVNVNLTGERTLLPEFPSNIKENGFLASQQGEEHFEQIKTYYRNLVTWLSPPDVQRCINFGWVVFAVGHSRAVEAIVSNSSIDIENISPRTMRFIGAHGLDIIASAAGECQSRSLLPWISGHLSEVADIHGIFVEYDPWAPEDVDDERQRRPKGLGIIDMSSFAEAAMGAAFVEANYAIGAMVDQLDQDSLEKAMVRGFKQGISKFREAAREELELAKELLDRGEK